jgi:hypothetical protein
MKINITLFGSVVPIEHGVYRGVQLGHVALVNATTVDPDKLKVSLVCQVEKPFDFGVPGSIPQLRQVGTMSPFVESDLLSVDPAVRQNPVLLVVTPAEVQGLESASA